MPLSLHTKVKEQIDCNDSISGECSTVVGAQEKREVVAKTRVLEKETIANEEETIEEMVRRVDCELEEKLESHKRDLEKLEEKIQLSTSFFDFPDENATTIAAATPVPVEEPTAEPTCLPPEYTETNEIFEEDDSTKSAPYCKSYLVGINKNARQIVQSANDTPIPDLVGHETSTADDPRQGWSTQDHETTPRVLPPHRERNAYQGKGCRQHLTVSRKGVIDNGYLVSGRGPEYRPRYRFSADARIRLRRAGSLSSTTRSMRPRRHGSDAHVYTCVDDAHHRRSQ